LWGYAGGVDNERSEATDGIEVLAASLRTSSKDLGTFMRVLAEKLEVALPAQVRVDRRRVRKLSGEREVRGIECDLGERRYSLGMDRGQVDSRRATVIRGVVLKSERLKLDDWIDALAADLAVEAQANEQASRAVELLLLNG
jgi:hypothetical protein